MRGTRPFVAFGIALLGFVGCRGILDIEDGTLLESGGTGGGGASSSGASGMQTNAGGGGGLGGGGTNQSQGGRTVGDGGMQEAGSAQGGNEPSAQGGTTGPGGGTTSANGGTSGDAGSTSDGGTLGKGGADNRGGATSGSGGTSNGGATSTGGVTNKGGASNRGGATSSGGTPSNGGTTSKGGTTSAGGTTTSGGSGSGGSPTGFDVRTKTGKGESSDRFFQADVSRNGVNYHFIANGYGATLQSQTVSFDGTAFTVKSLSATADANPASYPAMFCGNYAGESSGACGLPKTISTITSLMTGWRWSASATGVYDAAYDIWLSNNGSVSGYVMVWLYDPAGKQPIGSLVGTVMIGGQSWNVWKGTVNARPCVSYVRPVENSGLFEYEFDAMHFIRNAQQAQAVPGNQVSAVAVGFEIWNGPITNLATQDFYVEVE